MEDDFDNQDQHTVETLENVTALIIELNTNDIHDDCNNYMVHSHLAQIVDFDEPITLVAFLQDSTVIHAFTTNLPTNFSKSIFTENFHEVLINICCARGNTVCVLQYKVILQSFCNAPYIDRSKAKQCHFVVVSETSRSTENFIIPFGDPWLSFDFHAIMTDVPIFL